MRNDLDFSWRLFKKSAEGKESIENFTNTGEAPSLFDFVASYNPQIAESTSQESFDSTCEDLWCYVVSEHDGPKSWDEAEFIFEDVISAGLYEGRKVLIAPGDYNSMLCLIPHISLLLYIMAPQYFFPYMWWCRFHTLVTILDMLGIEVPNIPKKSDYKNRCLFYLELCRNIHGFREKNNMTPEELCSFLYSFSPNLVVKASSIAYTDQPRSAWFIGGRKNKVEATRNTLQWQSNIEAKKGDILVFYETSPASAVSCIYTSKSDGVIDPFFYYYSYALIGDIIETPPITLQELKADGYFSKHPLVKKNFQGVNGWHLTAGDYDNLLRMFSEKRYDVTKLPRLQSISYSCQEKIELEVDVERLLLEPLLTSLGFELGRDYIRQLGLHAGRGHRVFPDYSLHYSSKSNEESAQILIEAKRHMKSNKEIYDAFVQARSYALLLGSRLIVLCDKECLLLFEKINGVFTRDYHIRIYWSQLSNPDTLSLIRTKFART